MRSSKEREDAIEYFKKYHGNHTHEVLVTIDADVMLKIWRKYYKGRVDIEKYGFEKLPLKKAP